MTAPTRLARLVQEYETNFRGGTIPSWCPLREDGAYAGATIAAPSAPGGGVDLRTSPGGSRNVGLRVARPVDLTTVKMVEALVVMTGGGDSTTALFLGLRTLDGSRGGGVGRNANNGTVYLRSYAPAQTNVETTFQAWSGALRHTIGYRLFPNEVRGGAPARVAQLLIDGQTFAERTFTAAQFPLDVPVMAMEFVVGASSGSTGVTARTLHQFTYREYLR